MNKAIQIIIIVALVAVVGMIFAGGSKEASTEQVEVRDGVQYITIEAGGGYSPELTEAKSGIPTKLIMKTTGALDCSSALVIRSIGYQKFLPQTGETEIDLGVPKAGVPLTGVCSMGMYSFRINFI